MNDTLPRIFFNEVVTRDGFQIEPQFVPTETKVALIDELSRCGYAKIEVTSFTSAKAIPMLRDAEEVMGRIARAPGGDRRSPQHPAHANRAGTGGKDKLKCTRCRTGAEGLCAVRCLYRLGDRQRVESTQGGQDRAEPACRSPRPGLAQAQRGGSRFDQSVTHS